MSRHHSPAVPTASNLEHVSEAHDLHASTSIDLMGVLFWTLCCIGVLAVAYAAQTRSELWNPLVDRVISLIGQ
ncbi:MAG: hypothetical protein AAB733_04060 [Patescibacteria group bacterium]